MIKRFLTMIIVHSRLTCLCQHPRIEGGESVGLTWMGIASIIDLTAIHSCRRMEKSVYANEYRKYKIRIQFKSVFRNDNVAK